MMDFTYWRRQFLNAIFFVTLTAILLACGQKKDGGSEVAAQVGAEATPTPSPSPSPTPAPSVEPDPNLSIIDLSSNVGALTAFTSATFTFSGTSGASSFECKLDTEVFTACSSPKTYSNLSEGVHNFQVRATNAAGTQSATVTRSFRVDRLAPVVTLTSSVTNPTASTSATMTFSATDTDGSGVQGFECKLDTANFAACTSPVALSSLSLGEHAFTVRARDQAGNLSSSQVFLWSVLSAPSITTQPIQVVSKIGQAASFQVVAAGSPTLTYQWKKAAQDIPGATSPSFTIQTTSAADEALYQVRVSNFVGSVLSSSVNLIVHRPPTITTQPTSLTLNEGAQASFAVVATGRGALSYQWLKDNQIMTNVAGKISGVNAALLNISNITPSDQAWYTVLVTDTLNGLQQTLMSEYRNLVVIPAAPTITAQPSSLTVNSGSSATFSVTASGASVSYQWLKAGASISGATSSTYSISSAQAADAGSYSVRVSNAGGSVTSNTATLAIHSPPTITTQPASTTGSVGDSVTFSVTASGSGSLSYQWFKGASALANSATISGASTAQLTLSNLQVSSAGAYSVRITSTLNGSTQTTNSASANLTVNSLSGIARFNALKVAISKDQTCALIENDGTYWGAVYCWGSGSPNRSMTPSLVGTYATDLLGAPNGDAMFVVAAIPGGAKLLLKWTSTATTPTAVPGLFAGAIISAHISDDGNSYCVASSTNILKCHQEHTLYPVPPSMTGGFTHNSYDFTFQLPAAPAQVLLQDKFGCALANGQVYCWGANDTCQITRTPFTTETSWAETSWYQCYLPGPAFWQANGGPTLRINAQPVAFDSPDRITSFGEDIRQIALSDHSICAIGASGVTKCQGSNHDGDFPATKVWSLQEQNEAPQYRLFSIGSTPTSSYCENTHFNYNGVFAAGSMGACRATFGEPVPTVPQFYYKAHPSFDSILSGTDAAQIFSRYLIVSNSGAIKLWGQDRSALGLNYRGPDGGTSLSFPAVDITGISGNLSQVVRTQNALFFRQNGGVKVLGRNPNGFIGLGVGAPSPVQSATAISMLQSGVTDIVISKQSETTCALKVGKVYCWGDNSSSMLGNGSTAPALSPILVQ